VDFKNKVRPVVIGATGTTSIGATGTASKSFRKYLSNVTENHGFNEVQTAAIFGYRKY
jgi:hypothetical protein